MNALNACLIMKQKKEEFAQNALKILNFLSRNAESCVEMARKTLMKNAMTEIRKMMTGALRFVKLRKGIIVTLCSQLLVKCVEMGT